MQYDTTKSLTLILTVADCELLAEILGTFRNQSDMPATAEAAALAYEMQVILADEFGL